MAVIAKCDWFSGVLRLKEFLQNRKLKHIRFDLIKIDHGDFLDAADRLTQAEKCGRNSHLCPVGSRRVLLDLDSSDVHGFLLAVYFKLVHVTRIVVIAV